MGNLIATIAVIIVSYMAYQMVFGPQVEYQVKVTFCDNRDPIIVTRVEPAANGGMSLHIDNYKRAVPEWDIYYNVCEVRVVSRKTI